MMIGIDLTEVERLDKSQAFIDKIASSEEQAYINKSPCQSLRLQRLAALWSVKEAVMKALGLGKSSGVSFKDITLCHYDSGKPYVKISGVALEKMKTEFKDKDIKVSISHTEHYATAIAIIY